MYRRIVVPLDGSAFAEQALSEAERMARLAGAPVHLLRVIDVLEFEVARETAAASSYLQTIAERLGKSGLVADIEIRRGQTEREVIAVSRPGDVIVMASHGRGGVPRWFLGSVAEAVVRHATVPVLLVRATEPSASRNRTAPATAAVS